MAGIPPEDRDALLANEAQQLMNEFQIEMVEGSISRMRIYLSITLEKHYVIGIDFSSYPNDTPLITLQEEIKEVIGAPSTLDLIKNWDPQKPPHIIELIREIEGKLYEANKYWEIERIISGEFNTTKVPGTPNKLSIKILTYGWKEFVFKIILQDPPNPPDFEFSPDIQQIVGPLEEIQIYKEWDSSKYPVIELLREINWKIDKYRRLGFEVELLESGLKNVTYDKTSRKITAEVKGVLKTSDVIFKFSVDIPEDYPASKPNISLLSELEDDKLAKQMQEAVGNMLATWSPFNFLIDLFNSISKTIFNASVMVCIVCYSLECPSCGMPISAFEEPDKSCTAQCPHCQKPYHSHCWQKNIETIGKCAYCLRTPPTMVGQLPSSAVRPSSSRPPPSDSSTE
ncbi:MAG: hypothetical protein ACFFD2_29420 [Promethearchaeota archaeon]